MALILVLLIPLLVGGCTSPDPGGSAPGAPVSGSLSVVTSQVGSGGTLPPDVVTLTLMPSRPTVLEDLEAEVGGVSGPVSYRWLRNGLPLSGQTERRLPAGQAARGDLVTVIATTSQGEGRAQVTIVNSLPRVSRLRLKNPRISHGSDLAVAVEGADPDGDALSFRCNWQVNGEELYWERGPRLPGDKFRRGDKIVLRITPHDGKEDGPVFHTPGWTVGNAPPSFVSTPPITLQGKIYRYQVEANDPDGDSLSYELEAGPRGMQIDPRSGLLSWNLANSDSGEISIRIVAKDPQGLGVYQQFSLELTAPR